MLFNSIQFLIFFPITVLIYFFLPQRMRLFFLFLASCMFYLIGTPWYIAVIFLSILIDYFAARLISVSKGRKRVSLFVLSIGVNILLLGFFKYFNFLSWNVSVVSSFF
jgi:alginate O-acetyltransferase complex protein AlgI